MTRYAVSVKTQNGWALRSFDAEFEAPSLESFLLKVKLVTDRLVDQWRVVEVPRNPNLPVRVVFENVN